MKKIVLFISIIATFLSADKLSPKELDSYIKSQLVGVEEVIGMKADNATTIADLFQDRVEKHIVNYVLDIDKEMLIDGLFKDETKRMTKEEISKISQEKIDAFRKKIEEVIIPLSYDQSKETKAMPTVMQYCMNQDLKVLIDKGVHLKFHLLFDGKKKYEVYIDDRTCEEVFKK